MKEKMHKLRESRDIVWKFIQKCRGANESPLFTFIRYGVNRLNGVNMLVSSNSVILGRRNIKTHGLLQIGMSMRGFMMKSDRTLLNIRGELVVRGPYSIGKGCRLDIGKNAKVSLGGSGYISALTKIIISDYLTIGDGCAISWDCQILDTDFHTIKDEGNFLRKRGIEIGDNVWISSNVTLLKGARIPDGTVVAACSLVNREFTEPNTLIGGIPARILKKGIQWEM